MNVLIDGLPLFLNFGQVGDYSRLMVDNIIKYTDLNFKILKDYEITSDKYKNNSIDILLDRKNDNSSNLINYINSNNINSFHCFNNGFSIPKNYDFNYIMNISNLMPLFIEEICDQNYVSNFFNKLPYAILQSEYIICPSITCKNDLLKNFSMDKEKVIVNYGFLSDFYVPQDKFLSSIYISSRFNISNDYIFFTGDFHKRKNLDKVINLFYKLNKYFNNIHLIICCDYFDDLEYLNYLKNIASKLNLYDKVLYFNKLTLLDKVNLLNNALFFIDLSEYENLNLNLINAFRMNIPIICSPIPLYKEYLGDNAFYYFDNFNENILIDFVMNNVVSNEDLILSKFTKSINLDILTNIYNKFNN